jgi:alpha-tubulin suppressor-like RCC1 family protein
MHSCALLTGGTVKCWGGNFIGRLGNNTTDSSSTPVTVQNTALVSQLAVGGGHACALLVDKTVECWGANANGQAGNGERLLVTVPSHVVALANVESIACGFADTCRYSREAP